jgi:hypothetical protein
MTVRASIASESSEQIDAPKLAIRLVAPFFDASSQKGSSWLHPGDASLFRPWSEVA